MDRKRVTGKTDVEWTASRLMTSKTAAMVEDQREEVSIGRITGIDRIRGVAGIEEETMTGEGTETATKETGTEMEVVEIGSLGAREEGGM